MNQAFIFGGIALALGAGFAGSQIQKRIDAGECAKEVQKVRQAGVDALNLLNIEAETRGRERDQARAEVEKVNATTAAQYTALAAMLADDRLKREEASTRVEAAAKEAARNAKTAGERATAARDLISQSPDRCASAVIPDDIVRMLDGISDTTARGGMGAGAMPAASSASRP